MMNTELTMKQMEAVVGGVKQSDDRKREQRFKTSTSADLPIWKKVELIASAIWTKLTD